MMIVNRETEFDPVYFNSVTKPVINRRLKLEIFFQEISSMIHVGLMMNLLGMLN